LAALVVASLATACGTPGGSAAAPACKASNIPSHDDKTVVIEGDPWSGYAAFRNPHLLDGTGYTAQYVEQVCQDVRAGDVTAGRAGIEVTTLDQYVLNHPAGTVVGVIDQSEGADALVLDTVALPYLKSLDALPQLLAQYQLNKDKPVLAYTGNSPSEMLLNELSNTYEQLNVADFKLVSVDQSSTAFKMLTAHQAQLAVIWEPDTSAARTAGFTVALSSKNVPNSIVDVVIASNALIKRDPNAVKAVTRSFYSTMDRYLADPNSLTDFIAKDGNLKAQEASSVIAGIKLYGTRDGDTFMNTNVFPLDQPQIRQSLNGIAAILTLTHPGLSLGTAAIDGSYVAALLR
jgi:hypothetical protein